MKLGVPFWGGPHNKDLSILGSIVGFPYLGKLPYSVFTLPRSVSRCHVLGFHSIWLGLHVVLQGLDA